MILMGIASESDATSKVAQDPKSPPHAKEYGCLASAIGSSLGIDGPA